MIILLVGLDGMETQDPHGTMEAVITISLIVFMIFHQIKKLDHISLLGEFMEEIMDLNKYQLRECLMCMSHLEEYVEIIEVHTKKDLHLKELVLIYTQDLTQHPIGFLISQRKKKEPYHSWMTHGDSLTIK